MLLVAEAKLPPPKEVALHRLCRRIAPLSSGLPQKFYRDALDLLSEMPQILAEVGLEPDDFPDHSTLVKWFDRITMAARRVLLRCSAQEHEPSGHAAIDSTYFDRKNASKHYCRRTNYRVQTLKTTALVDNSDAYFSIFIGFAPNTFYSE